MEVANATSWLATADDSTATMFFDRLMFWELWALCALSSVKMTRSYYFVETKFLIGTQSLKPCFFCSMKSRVQEHTCGIPLVPCPLCLPCQRFRVSLFQQSHFGNSPDTLVSSLFPTTCQYLPSVWCFRGVIDFARNFMCSWLRETYTCCHRAHALRRRGKKSVYSCLF